MTRTFDLWGQRGWCSQEVAGESHYAKNIRALFGRAFDPDGDNELTVPAQLIPEPTNRYDPHAVKVLCSGKQVGHLPKEQAREFSAVLTALIDQGWTPQVQARVWAQEREDWDDPGKRTLFASVRIDLAEPHMIVPTNMPPSELHTVLPTGRFIQVTGEEKHMSHLASLISPSGESWVYVTLHEIEVQRARSTRTLVEVRINGLAAGTLSPAMSTENLPVIGHLRDKGLITAARAVLKGNRVKADVAVNLAKASELSDTWLDSPPTARGTHPAERAESSTSQEMATAARWRFVVPPEWPPPPAGWVPPQGWRPDPSWPPAPQGWQFWVQE
ncbi:HIRAN domain-containing protein [Micromonospora sp. NPDC052213]|uniref:HIRAN domain-containing protein n=1 Tax=Micromonospora sp. NPDC052213 TaxID=3155812 RepID=UPI0034196665